MKKYLSLVRYELKTILKDPMSLFMMLYPFLMLFLMGFVLPAILERTADPDSAATRITLLISFVVTLAVNGYVGGALLGFSLLDNKDENTLVNIAVSPIRVSGYTAFKLVYAFLFGVLSNLILLGGMVWIAKDKYVVMMPGGLRVGLLDSLTFWNILAFSVVSSLFAPTVALALPMVAKNKIEGFALMKSGGFIVMIPVLALLTAFTDWKQYLLGIVPNFWPVKALLNLTMGTSNPADLPFWGYMAIGTVMQLAFCTLFFALFIKKSELK